MNNSPPATAAGRGAATLLRATPKSGHTIVVMARKSTPAIRRSKGPKTVAAAEFKATCLQLMDRVRDTRAEYVVTKHGRPVAKLVPYDQPESPGFIGSMKGTVLSYERPTDPLDDAWDVNRDAD